MTNVIRLPVEWHQIPQCESCQRRTFAGRLVHDPDDGAPFLVCAECAAASGWIDEYEYAQAIGAMDLVEVDGRIMTALEADARHLPRYGVDHHKGESPAGWVQGWCILGGHSTVVAYLLRGQEHFEFAQFRDKVRSTRAQWLEYTLQKKTLSLPCLVCDGRLRPVRADGIETQ